LFPPKTLMGKSVKTIERNKQRTATWIVRVDDAEFIIELLTCIQRMHVGRYSGMSGFVYR
jgi:hypothetical protein